MGGSLGDVVHMDLDRMNRYDYAVEHLWALAAARVPVDAVAAEAVRDGQRRAGEFPKPSERRSK